MFGRRSIKGLGLSVVLALALPSHGQEAEKSNGEEQGGLACLAWLARHQDPDGHWGVRSYIKQCKKGNTCASMFGDERYDTAITGLSLIAFLGAGYFHESKDTYGGISYGEVVKNSLKWIINLQRRDGAIDIGAEINMYNHLIAGYALTEAYGLSGSDLFKGPAQKAVDFTVAVQNDDGGWGYGPKDGRSDTDLTVWAAMLLKSAELSGLTFNGDCYLRILVWIDGHTDEDGKVRYGARSSQFRSVGGYKISALPTGLFKRHEILSASTALARIFIAKDREHPSMRQRILNINGDLPRWREGDIDFYYWYNGSLAMFQYDGPAGPFWDRWNGRMRKALVENQCREKGACASGSWVPVDRWSSIGGRVYATAINGLTLEVCYRYASVFGGKQ